MKIELKVESLKSRFAIITFALIAIGFLGLLGSYLNVNIGFLNDIFFIFKTSGVVGLILLSFVFLELFSYFGFDQHKSMGMLMGVMVAVSFIIVSVKLNVLHSIEEFSIDARFRLSALEIQSKDVSKGVVLYQPNKDAHPAIEIVGIDQATVNYYQGFPLPWKYYADLLSALHGSRLKTVMFDIFFLDEIKNNYGLLSLIDNVRYDILKSIYGGQESGLSIPYSTMLKSNAYLSEKIRAMGTVTMDYPFEITRISDDLANDTEYQKRLESLSKYEIINVVPTEYDNYTEWVNHPEPPISSIGGASAGMGYANIRKEETGVNRTVPLVIKWNNRIYPSIDLVMAAEYYGVDMQKDIEVKLGSYVKIKNISPEKVKIGVIGDERDLMEKPNKDREVTIPIDEEGFMWIKFIGGPWSFPSYSFVDLATAPPNTFSGDNDPFANKILLVAMYYATGVAKDIHSSPFGDMAGIEHHANALNTILTQNFLYVAPSWFNYLILIAVGLILGYVVPRYNIKVVLITSVIIAILFTVEVFFVFNKFNFIHTFFVPYIQMVLTLITITGYKVLTEEENVKYIRSTFSKFVSKDIVNELLANPEALKLGGEKKELSIFFSDVRGFTTISESLTPEDLVLLLNDYLSVMTETIIDYKGTIDKYMGDAIMAFWGAPLQLKEHAYYACVASLKQLQQLEVLKAKWREQGWPIIDIGIGINTGFAVAGNMGSNHRMDYTVMGDTINLGSRLEGTNKVYGTRIIISEYTYEKVKDKVITRELDKIKVKGKTEPVTIYELIDIIKQDDFDIYTKLL